MSSDIVVARYTKSGILDKTFGSGGIQKVTYAQSGLVATDIAVVNGSVYVAATDSKDFYVISLTSTGKPNQAFGSGGVRRLFGPWDALDAKIRYTPQVVANAPTVAAAVGVIGQVELVEATLHTAGLFTPIPPYSPAIVCGKYPRMAYSSNWTQEPLDGFGVASNASVTFDLKGRSYEIVEIVKDDTQKVGVGILRTNPSGAVDTTFGNGGIATVFWARDISPRAALCMGPQGRLLVFCTRNDFHPNTPQDVFVDAGVLAFRLNTKGALDTTFGLSGFVEFGETDPEGFYAHQNLSMCENWAGQIVVCYDTGRPIVRRMSAAGKLDSTFGVGGKLTLPDVLVKDVVRSSSVNDTRIVAVGGDNDFTLARFTAAGALDPSFGQGGVVHTAVQSSPPGIVAADAGTVDSSGRVLVVGLSDGIVIG